MDFDYAIKNWFSSFLYLNEIFGSSDEDFLNEKNEEIIDLSKKKKYYSANFFISVFGICNNSRF